MKNRRAFTFIEIIVSMIIIAVVSIASLRFTAYCVGLAVKSDFKLRAANFARYGIEEFYWTNNDAYDIGTPPVNAVLWLPTDTNGWAEHAQFKDYHNGRLCLTYTNSADGKYRVLKTIVTWDQ